MKYANITALQPKRIYIYGLLNERPKKCKSSKTAPHRTIHKTPGIPAAPCGIFMLRHETDM